MCLCKTLSTVASSWIGKNEAFSALSDIHSGPSSTNIKPAVHKWMASAMHSCKPKVCFSTTGSLKLLKKRASILHMAYVHTAHGKMHEDTRAWKD